MGAVNQNSLRLFELSSTSITTSSSTRCVNTGDFIVSYGMPSSPSNIVGIDLASVSAVVLSVAHIPRAPVQISLPACVTERFRILRATVTPRQTGDTEFLKNETTVVNRWVPPWPLSEVEGGAGCAGTTTTVFRTRVAPGVVGAATGVAILADSVAPVEPPLMTH